MTYGEIKQTDELVDDELCRCGHFKSDHRAKYTGYISKGGDDFFEQGQGSCIMCDCSQFTRAGSGKRRRLDVSMAATLIQLDATPEPKQIEWAKENPDLAIALIWWQHLNAQEMWRSTIEAMKSPSPDDEAVKDTAPSNWAVKSTSSTDEATKSQSPTGSEVIKRRLFKKKVRIP